uniref:Uncharacterized protein n=1 Tax=Magallana gigas TaxID=29159 RepID=K1RC28_MAGGI
MDRGHLEKNYSRQKKDNQRLHTKPNQRVVTRPSAVAVGRAGIAIIFMAANVRHHKYPKPPHGKGNAR